jgi:hypothetical protein
MAKPTPLIPTFKVLLEMSGYASLTHWMARPLSKEAVAALSPEARRERKARSGQGVQAQGPKRAAVEEGCRSRRSDMGETISGSLKAALCILRAPPAR